MGAAGTVTSSKYLVDTGDKKILIDCGPFQGLKELRLKNWEYPPVEVSEIDLVLLTHDHIDHTGYPRLVKQGFNGPIYGTNPTLDIAKIILNDSAKIQEQEAERANKEGYSKHSPKKAGAPFTVLQKVRHGDRDVEVSVPDVEKYKTPHQFW